HHCLRHHYRDGLSMAGHGADVHSGGAECRHSHHGRLSDAGGVPVRADQLYRRSDLCAGRPAHPHLRSGGIRTMNEPPRSLSPHTVAASEAATPKPNSRLVQLLDSDLLHSFLASRLVVAAALMTLLMVGAALLSPMIAPHDPYDLKALSLLDSDMPPV